MGERVAMDGGLAGEDSRGEKARDERSDRDLRNHEQNRLRVKRTNGLQRREPESNRRIAVLQTAALPLGYRTE